jgi:hypothetical protein
VARSERIAARKGRGFGCPKTRIPKIAIVGRTNAEKVAAKEMISEPWGST